MVLTKLPGYNWFYTTSNDNVYILFLIIVILFLIIVNFKLYKRKNEKFNAKLNTKLNDKFNNVTQSNNTSTTQYQAPTETNPAFNMALTEVEKQKYLDGFQKIDGDPETLLSKGKPVYNIVNRQNDVLNQDSSLYTWSLTSNSSSAGPDTTLMGNYASLDDIGKSMTDTLGGIKTDLGYAILDEQIGTFKKIPPVNPFEYDNTADYHTGMDSNTVDGVSNLAGYGYNGQYYGGKGGTPIYLQKDFTGVANIFAPNIIVANPPLNSHGLPDISFSM